MCGICGYVGDGMAPETAGRIVARMAGRLQHRGPDAGGQLIGEGFGLGHRRLAIVGLADGAQPMQSADGRLSLSFNGEIFNHVALRRALEARGHVFRTRSDTEVILHLYARYGLEALDHMNGDFAFALHDRAENRMLLARDRMGVRPLYHAEHNGCLWFASEIKALLAVPGIEAEIDVLALDEVFTFWAPLAPRTLFAGISELPPGHLMLARRGERRFRQYWDLRFPDAGEAGMPDARQQQALADEVLALLADATRLRMQADVPVGAYLSGGLDSAITATLAKPHAPAGLKTFSVTFDSADHDESAWQRLMVDALHTEHVALAATGRSIAAAFPSVVRHAEKPLLRTAPAPLHLLAGAVRDHGMKVVLTGEGADEVFAGYDIFKEARVRRFAARDPGSRRRPLLFSRLYPYLPGLKQQTPDALRAFFAAGPADLADPLFSHRPRFRSTSAAKIFYSAALRDRLATAGADPVAALLSRLPADFNRWHGLHQAQYLETRMLLPDYILSSQGDRMAMSHGIEGRFPFLDHRVVEHAATIPPALKLRGLTEKAILRQATAHLLPPAIASRTKQPYRAPESAVFFEGGDGAEARRLMGEAALAATGLFEPRAVQHLFAKCRRGSDGFRDNAGFVGILSTQLWHEAFVGRLPDGRADACADTAGAHALQGDAHARLG